MSNLNYKKGLYNRLNNLEYAAAYLKACLSDSVNSDTNSFLLALKDVVLANSSVQKTAKASGISRGHLHTILSLKSANPTIDTLCSILDSLGIEIDFKVSKKRTVGGAKARRA